MATLLAADIGGTKTDLALFDGDGTAPSPKAKRRYLNAGFSGFEALLAQYLEEVGGRPVAACIALAGVVTGERVTLTNLPWIIDSQSVGERFGLGPVLLVNDLTALAMALPSLAGDDLVQLQRGTAQPGEPCAVIAPGTGLGEGMLLEGPGGVFARGSEGGHCDFAPVDEEQSELLLFARRELSPVSYESLVAGPGLSRLYRFSRERHGAVGDPAVAQAIAEASDPIPLLVEAALRPRPCPLCLAAVRLFLAILGSEAGNLALKLYARGGVYLGGGLLPALYGRISFAPLLERFRAKGPMSELLASIPVYLVTRGDAALLGAGRCGQRHFAAGAASHGPR